MLSSHVSTGLARRSLSVIDCILLVNFGVFRASVLKKAGDYAKTIWEDFEMTLRVHKLGYKLDFELKTVAKSACPPSIRVLGKQRLRWFRGTCTGSACTRICYSEAGSVCFWRTTSSQM